jgi:hypothetical protein
MASSVLDSASDLGRKAVNRVETVLGDDAREISRRAQSAVRSLGDDYRYFTGGGGRSKAKKTAARSGRKTSGRA